MHLITFPFQVSSEQADEVSLIFNYERPNIHNLILFPQDSLLDRPPNAYKDSLWDDCARSVPGPASATSRNSLRFLMCHAASDGSRRR